MLEIVNVIEEHGIIEVNCRDDISEDEIMKVLPKIFELISEKGHKKICARSVDLIEFHSTIDYLEIFDMFKELSIPRDIRIAIVGSKGITKEMRFFEDLAANRNWFVKAFDEAGPAYDWLNTSFE